jgi:hypothetical protein
VKRVVPILFVLLLSCGEKRYTAQECRALELTVPQRCFGGSVRSGKYVGELKCWPFSKPHRMRGVWVFGLEASDFAPNASRITPNPVDTWLDVDEIGVPPQVEAAFQSNASNPWAGYAIDFVGRQSLCDENYGQFGSFKHEVIVEQFNSIRRLPLPKS